MNPTIIEIVQDWLTEHHFDGLCNVDLGCGCGGCPENTLCICNCPGLGECRAAYMHRLPNGNLFYSTSEAAPENTQ